MCSWPPGLSPEDLVNPVGHLPGVRAPGHGPWFLAVGVGSRGGDISSDATTQLSVTAGRALQSLWQRKVVSRNREVHICHGYLFIVDRSIASCNSGRSFIASFASAYVNHLRSRLSFSGHSSSSLVTVHS